MNRCSRSSSSTSMPRLDVSPQVALVDEKICITASGLRPVQKVTLQAVLRERRTVYSSCAQFVADQQGCVNTTQHSSLGGTYQGTHCMGVFWSLKQLPEASKKTRLLKTDVTTPLVFELSLSDGHLEDLQHSPPDILATATCERWFKHGDVRRVVVREGSLRGTLFLPPGAGPFPGVLDMFGMSGGLFETRAALLASRGFAAMALAYIGYDDPPTSPEDLDARYFITAVDWLSDQEFVQPGGIGVVGLCKGGELAFLLGSLSSKVKVIVNVSGLPGLSMSDIKKDGEVFMKVMPDLRYQDIKVRHTEEGAVAKNSFPDVTEDSVQESIFPVWKGDARILYMCGGDDQTWDTAAVPSLIQHMWPPDKINNIEFVLYPGAGHLIEPPYMPLCRSSWFIKGIMFVWGGQPEAHAAAQELAWGRLLDFLQLHLHHRQSLNCLL